MRGAVSGKLDEIANELEKKKNELAFQAEQFKNEKKKMLDDFEREKRQWVTSQLKGKLDSIFDYAMTVLAVHTKEVFTDDPWMPDFVKSLIRDFIDAIWPDVKEEAKDVILQGVAPSKGIAHGEPPCCGCFSPISWIRYTLFPYDRNIWRLIRSPIWWLFTLAYIFPKYGVSQVAYGFNFLIIDQRDEFQLQEFIVKFKSLQFISLGVLSALVGSVQYYICTHQDNCSEWAPQESAWTAALFVLQILLVWFAFLLLRCSRKKGGQYYQLQAHKAAKLKKEGRVDMLNDICVGDTIAMEEAHEASAAQKARSRGRLMKFLIYDFIIFLICVGLACWMAFHNYVSSDAEIGANSDIMGDRGGNWKFKSGLFWLKAFYGFMAFPFVLLLIPGISTLLSHARPTGYNPWGNTVPYIGMEEEMPTPWRPYQIDPKTGKRVENILPL